ncbi:uncharacterized protein [Mytilus edulis]
MVKQNRKRHKSTDSSSSRTEHDIINRNEKENELVVTPRTLRKRNSRKTEIKEPGIDVGENSSQISDNGANESNQTSPSTSETQKEQTEVRVPKELDKEEIFQTEKSLSVVKEEEKLLTQKSSEEPNRESPRHIKLTKTKMLTPKKSIDVSDQTEKPSPKKSSGVSKKSVKLLEKLLDESPKKDVLLKEKNLYDSAREDMQLHEKSPDLSTRAEKPESKKSSEMPQKAETLESKTPSDVSKKETAVFKHLKRKHRKITTSSNDTVMDVFDKAITICLEDEESDDDAEKHSHEQSSKRSFKDIAELSKKIGETEIKSEEKADHVESKRRKKDGDEQMMTLADYHMSQEGRKTNSERRFTRQTHSDDSNLDDDDDHSIDNIIPSIQSDPVLHQHQEQVSRQYQGFPRPVDSHDEDAIAAARLMTDMASCRNISYAPHSNGAETHVTNSRYGYCSSVDHGEVYPRPNYHGNYPLQAMYGQSPSSTWQPNMFGQPVQDPYGQWEGNFQNIAMYDSNNNIINQGQPPFQSPENTPYGNMGMPVRMSGSNTSQHRMSYEYDDEARLPPDYRNFHPLPMGVPLDYSVPRAGIPGQNIPFQEVGNVPMDCRRQVRKIVLLDQKHDKHNFEDDGSSPTKRRKRSRQQQIPQESVANYDEIVKNLFVPAPPTKTVLIHPKFMSKDRGSKVDVDPTHVRSISHRGLIRKYIDYLLMENEYITEISKAVSLPMDNCVMDDPYLMDVIRVKIPFPTPKYMQFLKDFYPAIQVDWKALNHQLDKYRSGGDGAEKFHSYYLDNRAVPVLLGEAFYFFQREGDRKVMEEKKKC